MALNESEITQLWERKIGAEIRALYFAELANTYSRRRQNITLITFFLSSGAASTFIAKMDPWVPVTLSVLVALLSAYQVAFGLERLVATLSKLQLSWHNLANDYEKLWNHTYTDTAQQELYELAKSEAEFSNLAATSTPEVDEKRLIKWQDRVFQQYHLEGA